MAREGQPRQDEPDRDAVYPIRTVSELTGVNAVTLRAWERRYGLIRPARTPKGHRLYSPHDIERIEQILSLLRRGIPVGRVRELIDHRPSSGTHEFPGADDPWDAYRDRMLDAVGQFDDRRLESVYNDALALYPVDVVAERLIRPVMDKLREHRRARLAGEAEQRFFVSYLRYKLGARLHHMISQSQGSRVLFACLPGEDSDVGLLVFALATVTRGYHPVLLGPDVPLEALTAAAPHAESSGIVLFADIGVSVANVATQLRALVRTVTVPVFVGGQIAPEEHAVIEQAGATALPAETAAALARIDAIIGAPPAGT